MNLLALDQSSHITGWAVFHDEELFKYGKFTVNDSSTGTRLVRIKQKVAELIKEYSIDEVIFEDIQQQNNITNNVQTFKILAEVYGVISEYLAEEGIPHTSTLASQWKSTLGIKGRNRQEQKKNAQAYVTNNYGVKPTQDEADAICIGLHQLAQSANDWSN